MKKFTFLLSLLGLSASSAFAGVFVPSTDGNTHVYAIKNASQTQYYCSVKGNNIGSTTNKSSVAYFKIVESETTDQYYVLCLNNNKYVTYSEAKIGYNKVSFTDSKENAKLWKIKQESGQTERYDIFPSTVSGTDDDPSWNWVGGAQYDSNLSLWNAKDGSSSWTFEECRQNLTLKYTWDGTNVVKTETVVALPGADKGVAPATGIEYTNVGSMSPATIDASTNEYTITIGEDLPFQKSTNFADATWYVMDVHGNHNELPSGKQYVWTYNTDNSIKFPRTDLRTATYSDNMLWCFMGDVQHGFKIYNKAAGKSLTLRKATDGETLASMSDQDNRNVFKLHHSQQSGLTENGFCFKIEGDNYYLNAPGKNDNKTLSGWNQADGGSTSRVFAPESYPTNYADIWLNAPEGAITGKTYLDQEGNLTSLRNAKDAVSTNASIANINALTTINSEIQNSAASTFKEGYYRLVNRQDNKYLHINNNIMNAQANKEKAVGSVVYFKSAGEGTYNLMMEGLYFGAITKSNPIALGNEASKGTYTIEFLANNPVAKIHESTNSATEDNFHYLHENNGNAVGWEAGEGIVPSHWYVCPATDIEVALNNAGEKSYATAYLPFGVSAISGAEAYVGTLDTGNSILNMTQATSVPAEKGFVLVGAADAKATLTIGNVTETVNSDLTGTNTAITLTDDNRANYLVFGKNKDAATEVGFFKPSTSVPSIPANKAYLNKPASNSIVMNFGGNTTGVNTVVLGENGMNAPVFDLSGRRVVAPVKGGVYIQNGKKFIK